MSEKMNLELCTTIFIAAMISGGIGIATTNMQHSFAQQNNAAANSSNLLAYENPRYGVKIQYPSNWHKLELNQIMGGGQFIALVRFDSPAVAPTASVPEDVAISVQNLTSPITTLDQYTTFGVNGLRQFPNFQLIESSPTTLSDSPAHKVVFSYGTGPATVKSLQVWTISGGKAYSIAFSSDPSGYTASIPTVQQMVNSFALQNAAAAPSTSATPVAGNAITPANTTTSTNTNSSAAATSFQAAKDQYLTAWNHTTFHSGFDTFIQEGSATGYGVYVTHAPVFKPGDSMVLYVEPVGYGFKQVVDAQGNTLNQINLTADVTIAASNGTQLTPPLHITPVVITSHDKNTELFMGLRVDQSSPYPVGDYKITYNFKDGSTGKSFQLIKTVKVANIVSP